MKNTLSLLFAIVVSGMLFTPLVFAASPKDPSILKAPAGLHVVFDASASMCGYFNKASDSTQRNALLDLVKRSWIMRNPALGNEVFVLQQERGKSVDARRDIKLAPPTFLAESEVLAEKGGTKGSTCSPYNGSASNLELIFDKSSWTARAEAIILVTDAQLEDKDRERFVQVATEWAQSVATQGGQPYAGVSISQRPFSGVYYPISDPSAQRKKSGYLLKPHDRPLVMFWFSRSDKHLKQIAELAKVLAPLSQIKYKKAAVQNILPALSVDYTWLDEPERINAALKKVLSDKIELQITKVDSGRSDFILGQCARRTIVDSRILVEIASRCRDGKPFFEGLAKATLATKPAANRAVSIKPIGMPDDYFRWPLRPGMKDSSFALKDIAVIQPYGSTAALKDFSIDSDYCPESAKTKRSEEPAREGACENKLAGRTYQFDVLIQSLTTRTEPIARELLRPLMEAHYTLAVQFAK